MAVPIGPTTRKASRMEMNPPQSPPKMSTDIAITIELPLHSDATKNSARSIRKTNAEPTRLPA